MTIEIMEMEYENMRKSETSENQKIEILKKTVWNRNWRQHQNDNCFQEH